MLFISNYYNNRLINVAHIVDVSVSSPCLEQKDYIVYANLTNGSGTAILYRGTAENCTKYLNDFEREVQKNG